MRSPAGVRSESHRCSPLRDLFSGVSWAAVIACLGYAHTAVAQQPDGASEKPTVTWSIDSSHTSMPLAGERIYLRLRVDATELPTPGRQPQNLAFVFDKSNSMTVDNKIQFLRKAAHLAVDNLKQNDYVAMVAYHHEVETMVPMHPAVNREYLHDRIDEIEPDGYTNISGGLLEGIAQVQTRMKQAGNHHIILMTDGEANRGIVDPNQLVELTRKAVAKGMTVSTMGVGIEFNETLLTRMAQAGNGRYLFVKNADQIPEVLQKELGALLAVAVQNAKLTLKLPAGMEVVQVFGRHEPLKPGALEIPLGDLTSGQMRRLVICLKTSGQPGQVAKPTVTATLSFDNLISLEREQSEKTVSFDPVPVAAPPLSEVLAYARLVEWIDRIGLAVRSMDEKVAGEVLQFRQAQFPVLKQMAVNSREQDFLNKAFIFEHYAHELAVLIENGALHEHSEARHKLQKELHYKQYLMEHHGQTTSR